MFMTICKLTYKNYSALSTLYVIEDIHKLQTTKATTSNDTLFDTIFIDILQELISRVENNKNEDGMHKHEHSLVVVLPSGIVLLYDTICSQLL